MVASIGSPIAALSVVIIISSICLGITSAQGSDDVAALRPPYFKQWRDPTKIILFGDSISDFDRRYRAPASVDIGDIGPYPWFRLFESPDSDTRQKAYAIVKGSATNGKVWSTWYRIPRRLNFATVSASATDAFRSRETCTGYTGEGEDEPTGTLGEQITYYIANRLTNIFNNFDVFIEYTHVIIIGAIEPTRVLEAYARYTAGGEGYVDPVAYENVFEDVDGVPTLTFAPMIREVTAAWQDGIDTLREAGVVGRIMLANIPSPRGIPSAVASGLADILEPVSALLNTAAQEVVAANSDVRLLDLYSLSAAVVDQPEIFTSLGFTAGSGSSLGDPCLTVDFFVDTQAEIMGTQGDRAAGCQEECALCADGTSPCQNCLEGNPSGTICEDPETYIYWDDVHFTQDFHLFLGEAIRHCTHDSPNYEPDWVEVLCPGHP